MNPVDFPREDFEMFLSIRVDQQDIRRGRIPPLVAMEEMFRSAARAQIDMVTLWIGEILFDTVTNLAPTTAAERQNNPARIDLLRLHLLRTVHEEMGDRLRDTNLELACTAWEKAIRALERLTAINPGDLEIGTDLRDVAGKLTILKGSVAAPA